MLKYTFSYLSVIAMIMLVSCNDKPSDKVVSKAYAIDTAVIREVAAHTEFIDSLPFTEMDMKFYQEGQLAVDTRTEGQPMKGCITVTQVQGDTLHMVCMAGVSSGFGYRISFFRDTCIVQHMNKGINDITYKLTKDGPSSERIVVPCTVNNLRLSRKPDIAAGDEKIDGIIDLTTNEYYALDKGMEAKIKMQFTGYFSTQPLTKVQSKYAKPGSN